MRMLEFSDKYLAPYQIRQDELVPRLCPFCNGGERQDTHTFALNLTEGVFVCKRGKCGAKGRFADLLTKFGEAGALDGTITAKPLKKRYDRPANLLEPITPEITGYFAARKISEETLAAFQIAADAQGNIVFPFYQDGVLEYLKYRKPAKRKPGEPKEWQCKGAKPILFGMDNCSFARPLTITEGQIDALSLYEAGVTNVVSVPGGSENLDWIETCWEWLERFQSIILFGDNDAPGLAMVQKVARRLGEARCMFIEEYPARPSGKPCKDANEILYFFGKEGLLTTHRSAHAEPVRGVINLADVAPIDFNAMSRIKTMIPALDEILGGLIEGSLTVITGKPCDGKSTLSGLFLLNAIEQGHGVCAYSGELTKERFQSWIHFQLAGPEYIGLKHDPVKNIQVPYISYPVHERLAAYYRDKFFLFNNNEIWDANQFDAILQVFTGVVRRYGCKLFLVDNLMTALSDTEEENRAQGHFVNMLKRFANQYRVHVLLVAHPRKTKYGESVKQDDIGGNSATIRLADSAIVVERPNLRIIKNREDGTHRLIQCCFCPDTRRIYQADTGDLNSFSWDREGLALPEQRADSLPQYRVAVGDGGEPF